MARLLGHVAPFLNESYLWERDGTPKDLGTLGDANNTMFNVASSINDLDEVNGTSQYTDGTVHSFLWTSAIGMQDIGTLPGAFATIALTGHSINNRGQVVGFSIDRNGSTAFLWQNNVIRDLNTLTPADSTLHLLNAESINDDGEIQARVACCRPVPNSTLTELPPFGDNPRQPARAMPREKLEGKRCVILGAYLRMRLLTKSRPESSTHSPVSSSTSPSPSPTTAATASAPTPQFEPKA
jgi:probable HAF family extracellular repeat protein